MQILTYEEWESKARSLYGSNPKLWEFRCPACGHVQSVQSILSNNPRKMTEEQAMQAVYYACEGRVNPQVGCQWISSNSQKIHTVEVTGFKDDAPLASSAVFWFGKDPIPMQWQFINQQVGGWKS